MTDTLLGKSTGIENLVPVSEICLYLFVFHSLSYICSGDSDEEDHLIEEDSFTVHFFHYHLPCLV